MKRLIFALMVIALLVPVAAFACHAYLHVNTAPCGEANVSYEFQGDGGTFQGDGGTRWFRGVASGALASFETAATRSSAVQTGIVFNGAKAPGTYSQTFKLQVADNVPTNAAPAVMGCPSGYPNPSLVYPNKCYKWVGWFEYADKIVVTPAILASDKPGAWTDYGSSETESVTVAACVVDLCTNLDGVQATMPAEYEDLDQDKLCTLIPIEHTVVIGTANTCPGASAFYSFDGGPNILLQEQTWKDPFVVESMGYTMASIELGPPHVYTYSGEPKTGTVTEEETCVYDACSKTIPTDPEEGWSDWVWDVVAQDEIRTRSLFDAIDTQHSCGTETQKKGYTECSKVNEVVLNGHIEWRDVNTNKLCESKCRDRWVQQQYGLFALEGPNGEYATMYVYADENGKLPIGVSVQRQECVLGWVAVNTPYAGWVYKNPCTGEYKWNDQTFTPRRDVIKHGVCDRSQPCLVQ